MIEFESESFEQIVQQQMQLIRQTLWGHIVKDFCKKLSEKFGADISLVENTYMSVPYYIQLPDIVEFEKLKLRVYDARFIQVEEVFVFRKPKEFVDYLASPSKHVSTRNITLTAIVLAVMVASGKPSCVVHVDGDYRYAIKLGPHVYAVFVF